MVSLLYDTLLDGDVNGGLGPNLAEHWELTPDGSRLTFKLNPQARWHNGQPVTAADVVFSFHLLQQNRFPGFVRVIALVHRVEAISPAEVEFTLFTTWPDAVRLLGTGVRIVPAMVWKDIVDPLHYANLENPVGSGPFLLAEFMPEKQLVLRNTGVHPACQPSVETLILEIYRDEGRALKALKDGKLDALGWDIAPAQAHDVQDHPQDYPHIHVAEAPSLSIETLLFNLRSAPFNNAVFRHALAQALDTQGLVDKLLLGFGDTGTPGLFPPASPWHNTAILPIPFDPQEATTKLTAAGFIDQDGDGFRENPDGSTLQIPITCPKQEMAQRIAEWIVAHWKAIGIAAKAEPVDQDRIMPTLMQAKFSVILHRLSFKEPEMIFFYFHSSCGVLREGQVSGLNYGGYANLQYDETVEALQRARNDDETRELLCKLQEILASDLPQIPLYIPRVLNLYRADRFSGWRAHPGIGLLSRTSIASLRVQ